MYTAYDLAMVGYMKVTGSISYMDSVYLEDWRLYCYGYYRNTYYSTRWHYYRDNVVHQDFYEKSLYQPDTSWIIDKTPFPIQTIDRRSYRCDQSTIDGNGVLVQYTYNMLEDFKVTIHNTVTAEAGPFPHRGPWPARILFKVSPLPMNCSDIESSFPLTDYIDVDVPRNVVVHGLSGRLTNRNYSWPPDIRLAAQ